MYKAVKINIMSIREEVEGDEEFDGVREVGVESVG